MYNNSHGYSNHTPHLFLQQKTLPSTTAMPISILSRSPTTSAPDHTRAKWVKTLSSRSHTKAQVPLLARGSNVTIVPLSSPEGQNIATIEDAHLRFPRNGREVQGRNQQSSDISSTSNLTSSKRPRP